MRNGILLFITLWSFQASAQSFLFDQELIKSFITSQRFAQKGKIISAGIPVTNRYDFVKTLPPPEDWKWAFTSDSVSFTVETKDGLYQLVFPNDINLVTGTDKKDRTDTLVKTLKRVSNQPSDYKPYPAPKPSAPNDSMYGILYQHDFLSSGRKTYAMGDILFSLCLQSNPDKIIKGFQLVVPGYGFTRDTVKVGVSGMNNYFQHDQWFFWLARDGDDFLLYAKNAFFNFAHMFYHKSGSQNDDLFTIELHAYIPDGNVRDLFKVFEEKPDGRGIRVE
ncbi:MAG: hypothetical protein JJU02_12915 [Cryomorphaceae bacterium]|nr:hypothetical protein [Cryomorphaceae bacterium]